MPTSRRLDRLSYIERIYWTMELLRHSGGRNKRDLKAALRQRYGPTLQARCIERLLGHARRLLLAELDTSKDEQRALAVAFYDSVVTGPDSTIKQKLYAQERIDRLLGLRFVPGNAKDGDGEGRV